MPDSGSKKTQGDKKMTRAGNAKRAAAKQAEKPLLGEAALQAALAGFGVRTEAAPDSGAAHAANGNAAAAGAQPEPGPKTVSQVLGEITWLMTQSPRHKAIPLGDLEWLVMPAILLKQFRIFYKGEQPVGVAVWELVDEKWRSGSTRATRGCRRWSGRAGRSCG